ncbi:MAG: hypothetical protein V7637_4094 [Mycobacteriales bacterium]
MAPVRAGAGAATYVLSVRFEVLGPLTTRGDDGRLLIPGRRKQRSLLGLLLLRAGTTVSTESIVDVLWGERPPPSAVANLQSYVADLRRLLASGEPDKPPRLASRQRGYRLLVDPDELDAGVFARLAGAGREALEQGDAATAADQLARALGQWRGRVLEDLELPALEPERARLEEQRLAAVEDSCEARLALGGHRELAAELAELVSQHPLRERMWALLMLALHRSDRPGDALAAYRRVAGLLDRELGMPPGAPLRRLHERILAADPRLDPPVTMSPPAPRVVPAQLPSDVRYFTGRAAELATLDALLDGGDRAPTEPAVAAVSGTAGVGKTALVLHWAHRVAGAFPDGQLFVNLRGLGPSGTAMSAAEAVRAFLDTLGVPPDQIPPTLDARAGLYRSLVAGKRMLVVLDNAGDAEPVRWLLPGTPTTVTVVTSRNQLADLIAAEGARPVTLDLLSSAEAEELLVGRLGPARVAAEPAAVAAIISRCARLPLALTVVAARAATHPAFPLDALAAELADAAGPLDALTAGDEASDVRAVLSWSYAALPAAAARLFRLLAEHPGPDVTAAAAASLTGDPLPEVRRLLAELARVSLLTEHAPGRYASHDLLRAYAADLGRTLDGADARRAATGRVLDHYLHSAYAADRLLDRHRDPIELVPPAAGVSPHRLTDQAQALSWLAAEQANLRAAAAAATGTGHDTHAWQLAWVTTTYLRRRGDLDDLAGGWLAGLAAAQRLDDPHAQALAHRGLGGAYVLQDRFADAHSQFRRALALSVAEGDLAGQAHTHRVDGWAWEREGRPDQALRVAQRALAAYRAAGHRHGQAAALNNTGWCHGLLGAHRDALDQCRQALDLFEELDDRQGRAITWDSIGFAHHQLGEHDQAVSCYQQAIAGFQELGERYHAATALIGLGDAQRAAGDAMAARRSWREALVILTDLRLPEAGPVAERLNDLAPVTR